mgnify:CR=1 FL=1
MIPGSRGKNTRDTEIAAETVIPYINSGSKGRNIAKSSSLGVVAQMLESESFDSFIDKKSKEP